MTLKSQIPIQIYTDGSFSREHGKVGGYGVVMSMDGRLKKFKSKCYTDTTSQRMDLKGVIFALEHVKPGYMIDIYCDSTYVTDGTNKWVKNWIRSGTLDEKANPDLWRRLVKALNLQKHKGSKITVNWIRGHAGNGFNEMADKLAFAAATAGSAVVCTKNN
jgi:ribonuclease HI